MTTESSFMQSTTIKRSRPTANQKQHETSTTTTASPPTSLRPRRHRTTTSSPRTQKSRHHRLMIVIVITITLMLVWFHWMTKLMVIFSSKSVQKSSDSRTVGINKDDQLFSILPSNYKTVSSFLEHIHNLERMLEKPSNLRYFVYDDGKESGLSQLHYIDKLVHMKGRGEFTIRYRPEAFIEHFVLNALETNPIYRTYNISQANFFIVPLRVGASVMYRGQTLPDLMDALQHNTSNTWNYGHRHVMIALHTNTFSYYHRSRIAQRHGFTPQVAKFFTNVTIAKAYDDFWCAEQQEVQEEEEATKKNQSDVDDYDYDANFHQLYAESKYTMTTHGFSVGLLPEPNLTRFDITYETWSNKKYWIFSRNRPTPYFHGSTPYRRRLWNITTEEQALLPYPSSVGQDLESSQWEQHFKDSKFCLAIRGDTPHTHALLRAVVVGCIPVVISDMYEQYAPTFGSIIQIQDYSIIVSEKDYMEHPIQALNQLQHLSKNVLEAKLHAIKLMQRIVTFDDLFVPAFVREAHHAMNKPPSKYTYYP